MAKPNKNNFDDIKMMIATLSITMTIVFWNLFAPASSNEATVQAATLPQISAPLEPVTQAEQPAPAFIGKILFGGQAPQPRVIVQSGGGGNNNVASNAGGGGGGGGTPATTTKSS